MKDFIITFIFACVAIVFMVGCIVTNSEKKNEYPLTTVVYNVSEATDTVTVVDFNGNLWQFKGVEDWQVGDICSCIMNSKGTELIKDDEVKKERYSGYFEGWKF